MTGGRSDGNGRHPRSRMNTVVLGRPWPNKSVREMRHKIYGEVRLEREGRGNLSSSETCEEHRRPCGAPARNSGSLGARFEREIEGKEGGGQGLL